MSSTESRRRHAFAPLGSNSQADSRMVLQGIVFDMDGTLCEPQNYMFAEMRSAMNITKDIDILDHVHALPEPQQTEAFAKIQHIERTAMANQIPQGGLVSLMEYLDHLGIRKAICTRNFDAPLNHLLQTHIPRHIQPFSPLITREFRPPKPSPAGILNIAQTWGITTDNVVPHARSRARTLLPLIMVGDSIDDMISGYEAGALTVLLRSSGKEELAEDDRTDVVIDRLDELVDLLKEGVVSAHL